MKVQCVLLLLLAAVAVSAPAEEEVTALKGYYDFSTEFKMYSGYLTLQETPLINIHYVFLTSKNQPATDDVVLWLNGGPGCSSLLGTSLPTQASFRSWVPTS
jgi:carboxypeptidase C (cathepsin A)